MEMLIKEEGETFAEAKEKAHRAEALRTAVAWKRNVGERVYPGLLCDHGAFKAAVYDKCRFCAGEPLPSFLPGGPPVDLTRSDRGTPPTLAEVAALRATDQYFGPK